MQISEEQIREAIVSQLQKKFVDKLDRHPQYSLRALARDIGVSPPFLSLCFRGKKRLPFDCAMKIARALRMTKSEADTLIKTLTLLEIKGVKERETFITRNFQSDWTILPENRQSLRILENWYDLAILELTTCRHFESSTQWIAERLSITPRQARDAIDRLIEGGFLKIHGSSWIKSEQKMQIPTLKSHAEVRGFHSQMMEKAQHAVHQTPLTIDFERRDFSGATFAADPKRVLEAKKMITEFRQKLADFLMDGNCTEVYQLNLQLFPLTKVVSSTRERTNHET